MSNQGNLTNLGYKTLNFQFNLGLCYKNYQSISVENMYGTHLHKFNVLFSLHLNVDFPFIRDFLP